MKLSIFIFIAALAIILISNVYAIPVCYKCVGNNQAYDNVEYAGICTDPDYFTFEGKCIKKAQLTENCTLSGGKYPTCAGELSCYNGTGIATCRNAYYIQVGSTCTANMQCMGSRDSFANNFQNFGVCADSKCLAEPAPGSGCGVDTCSATQYCDPNTKQCVAFGNLHDKCFGSGQCSPWLVCGPTSVTENNCYPLFSQSLGGICMFNEQCNATNGDYCAGGVCKNTAPTPSTVNCVDNVGSCQPYEFCDCDTQRCKITTKLDANYQQSYSDFFNCVKDFSCSLEGKNTPQSCVMKNCGLKYCKYLDVTKRSCQKFVSPTICTGYLNYTSTAGSSNSNSNSNSDSEPSSSNILVQSIKFITTVIMLILISF